MIKAESFFGAQASTALTKYQCAVLAPVTVEAFRWFPCCIQDVVRLPGWPVMLLPDWPACEYRLMVIMDCGSTLKSTGSVYTTCPLGMVVELEPLKVSPIRVVVSMPLTPAFPPVGRAIEAAVIGRSLPPKVFEI
jgi:hypothetical protein